jgi:hypothetical protein
MRLKTEAEMAEEKAASVGAAEKDAKIAEVAGALDAEPGVAGVLPPSLDTAPLTPPAQESPAAPENAQPEGGDLTEIPEPIVGDRSRWKFLDETADAYEIKDRGVIVRTWAGVAFIPGVKLAADINNGHRIVAG